MDNERANSILKGIVSNTRDRLANGDRIRTQMRQAMERGELPTGYRAAWLDETACRIFDTLTKAAKEFNELHGDDMISANDMNDALATAVHRLQKAATDG